MKTNLVKNTAWLAAGNICTKGINLIMIPLFSAWLSTEDYGTFDLYCTYITLLIPFLSLSSSDAIFRFSVENDSMEAKQKYITAGLSINLILGLLTILLLTIVTLLFDWKLGFPFIALLICELFNGHLQGFMRAIRKLELYSIGNIVSTICIAFFVTLFIYVNNLGVEGIIYGYAMGVFSGNLLMVIVSKYFKYISFRALNIDTFKEIAKYSLPLIPNNISWWIINVSDRSLINIYIGPAANGIYALACKIPNICASISGVFNVSWQEAAVDMLDSNERDTYYNKVLNQSVSILISVCAGILSFNYLLFEYLFDARYNEAALYSPILVASVVLGSVVLYFGGIQISFKRTKENGITTVFGAIVNVIFNIVFIPYIGIYAAALSTVIAQVVICILRYLRLRNTVDFKLTRHTLLCIVYFIYMAISCYICHSIIYSIFNIVLSSVMFLYINRGFVRKVLHKFI